VFEFFPRSAGTRFVAADFALLSNKRFGFWRNRFNFALAIGCARIGVREAHPLG
jgi:hypothetical protein